MAAYEPPASDAKVIVLTASVGAGHNSAARAVAEAFERAGGGAIEYLDVLDFTGRAFRAWYARGYAFGVSHLPRLYGVGYWLTNRPQRAGLNRIESAYVWAARTVLHRLRAYLARRRPRVIVNTHFLAPSMVDWMCRHGQLDCKQVVVVTDNVTHRSWHCLGVDHWFVPNPGGIGDLQRWGIPESAVTCSGIPVHPKWLDPVDRPVVKIARGIVESHPEACVVVLAGRSKALAAAVASQGYSEDRLRPVSFTDKLHELATVASVMVTKPGGITTAECLAKGLPMVLIKPVPGQEAGNARYLSEAGAALTARGAKDTVACVGGLLGDESLRSGMAGRCRQAYRPGAQTIAAAVIQRLRSDGETLH
ncbi:MAG: glycosyltransferase [Planctomycetota bacterium]|nr:glycosyltransferase [Planctomycetota bacterium]